MGLYGKRFSSSTEVMGHFCTGDRGTFPLTFQACAAAAMLPFPAGDQTGRRKPMVGGRGTEVCVRLLHRGPWGAPRGPSLPPWMAASLRVRTSPPCPFLRDPALGLASGAHPPRRPCSDLACQPSQLRARRARTCLSGTPLSLGLALMVLPRGKATFFIHTVPPGQADSLFPLFSDSIWVPLFFGH